MFCPKCGIENPDNGKYCRSCGANLTNVLAVVNGAVLSENNLAVENTDGIYSKGIRNAIIGTGFELVGFLLFTMPGNKGVWTLFMIPGFFILANGIMQIIKANAMKKAGDLRANAVQQPTLANQPINSLPNSNTEYVNPVSSFTTKDLVVPSVTEETTKHLGVKNDR